MARIVYSDGNPPPQTATGPFEESLTRQSEKDDADINVLLNRFVRTGLMPQDEREPLFIDVSDVGDYRQIRDHINRSTDYFNTLDAKVRAKFNNDPAEFLDRLVDPANKQEFVDLGILEATDVVPTKGTPEKAPVAPVPNPPA